MEAEGYKYEVFISKVAPKTSKEELSNCLVECYADFMKDKEDIVLLAVTDMDVKDMTPVDYIDPWKCSWQVSVPYKFKAVFEDENFYPNQWKFCQFYPARSTKKGKDNAAYDSERLILDSR